jgi:hypothetical protein
MLVKQMIVLRPFCQSRGPDSGEENRHTHPISGWLVSRWRSDAGCWSRGRDEAVAWEARNAEVPTQMQ